MDEKNSSLTLQVMWVGFKTEKIYFHRKDREVGESRWTLGKKIKLVVDSMMSFSYFPIRCMATLGFFFALCSLIGIIMVLHEKFTVGTPILGYASLMSVVLFGFGAIFIMLSVLGEYIWRALEEARKRPPFIIDEVRRNEDK
nr:glycosyltransferase [Butyrivibrio sp.]